MTSRPAPAAIVITGPTGTGKTDLAVDVAERLGGGGGGGGGRGGGRGGGGGGGGEIISADSRQIYRDMDIGTAKPSADARARVAHHGLDSLDPDQSYSAGRFARDAWRWIADIRERGRTPLIVGGTGFFIRALLAPLGPEPQFQPERRERLRRYLSRVAPEKLQVWLSRLDPERARRLRGEGGSQRLARSLEVTLLSGRPHSSWLAQAPEIGALPAIVYCLELPKEELYRSVDARFDRMMADGLLDEVRSLLGRYPADAPGLHSMGYAELAGHLSGAATLEQAVREAKRNTRRFAKRQLTWFRHQLPADAVWLDARRPRSELADEIVACWEESMMKS